MGQGQSARRVINDAAFVTDTTAAHLAETGQDSSRWVAEVHHDGEQILRAARRGAGAVRPGPAGGGPTPPAAELIRLADTRAPIHDHPAAARFVAHGAP